MNHIGTQYWPMRLQPSDYCEIVVSCQVCWRMRRWHNGRTRRSPNPYPEEVSRETELLMGKRAQRIPSWPGVIHSNKGRIHLRRPTRDITFRLRQSGGPYIPGRPPTIVNTTRHIVTNLAFHICVDLSRRL